MEAETKLSKRRRFRFTMRWLLALVTIVCLYFACWGPTKGRGVDDVSKYIAAANGGASSPRPVAPLLVGDDVLFTRGSSNQPTQLVTESTYYVWLFGLVIKTPFTKQWVEDFVP